MDEENFHRAIVQIMHTYEKNLRSELQAIWEAWKIDLSMVEVHEVVGAIVARQFTLAIQIARSPGTWNYHSAPIFLARWRITTSPFAWILKDPKDQEQRNYLSTASVEAKLQNEHRKANLKKDGMNPENDPQIKDLEAWINSQRYEFLTEVVLIPLQPGQVCL